MRMGLRHWRSDAATRAFRKPLVAIAVALVGAVGLLAAPALAQPPYPPGTTASALVGSPITVTCPPGSPGAVAGGAATLGIVTVSGPPGAMCAPLAATTSGVYTIAGATPSPSTLRFNAACENNGGSTNGFVDVPAGTTVPGLGVVAGPTPVVTPNTPVVYPNGTTAILNQVVTTPTSVTRNAIVITSGPAAGTVIGRVVCGGAAYPLAVGVGGASDTPAPVAVQTTPSGSNSGLITFLAAAGLALAALAHVAVGRRVRRRGEATA